MAASGITLATIVSLTAGWTIVALPPLHPAQLWATPWAIATVLYAARLLPYRTLSWETAGIAAGATLSFVAAAVAADRWFVGSSSTQPSMANRYAVVRRAAVLAVSGTAVALAAFLAQAILSHGVSATLFSSSQLREAITRGELSLTIKYIYFAFAGVSLCATAAALAPTARQRRGLLGAAAGCGTSIYFATGRATVVSGAIVGAIAYSVASEHRIHLRRLVVGAGGLAALALVVFLVGGALIGKTFANNQDLQRVPSTFTHHMSLAALALPYEYASAPIAALDVQVGAATPWGDAHGCAILSAVCTVLHHLGFGVPTVSRIRPFTSPPLPWNAYTALDAPLIDGGTALAIPIIAALGCLCGLLWRLVANGSLVGAIGYALVAVALLGAWGSFSFTAPYLMGAFVICWAALWIAGANSRALPNRQLDDEYPSPLGPVVR